jgi:hypothetical protein
VQSQENRLSLNTGRLHGIRDTVNQKRVAPLEPLLGEIRDDAALQLAADTVSRQHLGDDKVIGGVLARTASQHVGASDSVAP